MWTSNLMYFCNPTITNLFTIITLILCLICVCVPVKYLMFAQWLILCFVILYGWTVPKFEVKLQFVELLFIIWHNCMSSTWLCQNDDALIWTFRLLELNVFHHIRNIYHVNMMHVNSRRSRRFSSRVRNICALSSSRTAAAIGIIMAHVAMLASHIDRKPTTAMLPNIILHNTFSSVSITTKQIIPKIHNEIIHQTILKSTSTLWKLRTIYYVISY